LAAILVVEPFLKSLKVVPFMDEANISSEKVAVTLVVVETPLASAAGKVLLTVGAVVSPGEAAVAASPQPDPQSSGTWLQRTS